MPKAKPNRFWVIVSDDGYVQDYGYTRRHAWRSWCDAVGDGDSIDVFRKWAKKNKFRAVRARLEE